MIYFPKWKRLNKQAAIEDGTKDSRRLRYIEWRRLCSKSSFKMNSFWKENVLACNFRFHIWHQSKFIKVPFQFSTNLQKIAKRTVTNKHLENHIACFFPVGPQHSRWWKGDHKITSSKQIAASVQQFWGGSVLSYQWNNLAFFWEWIGIPSALLHVFCCHIA